MILIKKRWIYLVDYVLVFYLIPFIGRCWSGLGDEIFLVLLALPCATLIISIIYGVMNGFDLIQPVFVGIVFLSTIFIFYNYTAWVYILVYMVISIIGSLIGSLFYKRIN